MNQNKIYVANLPYNTTEEQLREFFNQFGNITELKIVTDRATGRSKGFAFITFNSTSEANAALSADGSVYNERTLKVNIARDKSR
ncbi:MAG: hypothetical protein A3E87_00520 [Gammaproteobacteria bacterium RIFCSPHIGHO2_12_FULL_35_23]|nr:MAG: hypothetical protein A3E87_00520 [Gammaproteobacteria bacterium RIFCSPHIGHO2_12_FULL_35_23]